MRLRRCGPRRGGARRLLRGEDGGHREHAGQRLDRLLGGAAQRLQLRPALRLDLDGEADMALAQLHARYHAEADDILAAVGIDDLAQRGEHLLLGQSAHGGLPLVVDIRGAYSYREAFRAHLSHPWDRCHIGRTPAACKDSARRAGGHRQ